MTVSTTSSNNPTIARLDEIVAELPQERRSLFERIFRVDVTHGTLVPPPEMVPWIERQFGSTEAVVDQKIVRVTNLITLDGILFNWLRSSRPIGKTPEIDFEKELAAGMDSLRDPYTGTPADAFGRIRGRCSVTASNIAKFDGWHGLVVFDEPHPLRWDREMLNDYLETGERWAQQAHQHDPEARYYLFLWNCLWRAGASLVHGHAQVLLGRHLHYPAVEALHRAGLIYQADFRSNYFEDLYQVHQMVGCAFERHGVRILASLTPKKEHGVMLMAPGPSRALWDTIYDVLACLRDQLHVRSFNVVVYQPPLGTTEEDWAGFPVIVHIVDRGDPNSRTVDFGAMELYAASVISSDPFELANALRAELLGNQA